MTEQPTNRLVNGFQSRTRAAFVSVGEEQVPTNIDDYCAWLNAKGERCGMRWMVVRGEDGGRAVKRVDDTPAPGKRETVSHEETQRILRSAGLRGMGQAA